MAVNVVSFSFSWCSTGGPEVHSAGCWLSLLHLISIFSGPQTPSGFPRAPSARCGFPYHISSIIPSPTVCDCHLTSVLTELYNSSTPTRSPTRSLEWHDWSSSSGNNCHAVHRSLSFGASVYECIMGFRMCHFFPVHHLGMAFLAGSKAKIQHPTSSRRAECERRPIFKRSTADFNSIFFLLRTKSVLLYTH